MLLRFISRFARLFAIALVVTLGIYAVSMLSAGTVPNSALENIHGIPFPLINAFTIVEEPLAHADIHLEQPTFAKELILTVQYIPTNITSLAVGIRENDFWLSYPKNEIYNRRYSSEVNQHPVAASVTIPLTDKFQESDQSLDLMFFAEGENPAWQLAGMKMAVHHVWPSLAEINDYVRAILKRERAQ